MSEQAMQAAQLAQAQQECNQLKTVVRTMSSQLGSQKQCIDEFVGCNIALRSSTLLLEEDINNLRTQINQTIERVKVLEREKAELLGKLAELEKANEPAGESEAA